MTCGICGNSVSNTIVEAEELLYGIGETFKYFECSRCGCLQIADIPADMKKYYPGDYTGYAVSHGKHPFYGYLRRKRDSYALYGSSMIGKILYHQHPQESLSSLRTVRPEKNWRILDVGCGKGDLLCKLRDLGFGDTMGVDPFIDGDIHYQNGLTIHKKYIFDIQGRWDLIMFHHSFEHIRDEKETLNKVFEVLDDAGVCMIRIPLASSWAWKHYGVRWIQFDAPRHFFLHTPGSISMLAEQCRFTISDVIFDSSEFQFWGSEQNMQEITCYSDRSYYLNRAKSIFSKKQMKNFRVRAEELNKTEAGDQAIFLLKKKVPA